ncbi:hypothetical protein GCM10008171_00600 [Methylopila jiangsuensis]|uniref:SGNH hydrolase-type esterase domain-containing protein n=1 Tax=Methylopila jiangsuensis TaxID=586230 RepID=A0A9W6JEH1_9HYPH|nr:GDSL-type esterase/lipase family protein [Methylopila jiangsuensis]MDR6287232.1 hypothetical protein [Methylopila jiangsuensis]GLK74808.1 hypothetical protein GCM10008171_00600 [Methylopila jiangsuensis]
MIRLPRIVRVVLSLLLAAAGLAAAAPASAQEGYYRRSYDDGRAYERVYREPRYGRRVYEDEDDRAFRQRMRAYQREQAYRREAAQRRGYDPRRRAEPDRPNFIQRLFGRRTQPDPGAWSARTDPGAVEVRPRPNRVRRKPAAPAPVEAAPTPAPEIAQPAAPAVAPTTFVAVIGDSIADGLATGLGDAFADAPELGVKRYVKANAGLVRTDYHDFVAAAREAVSAGPLAYAVIDVGVNDRQPFLDARDLAPLSPGWKRLYVARIDALLAPFREKNVPVYWVGLAPSESVRASSDHIALNALARERVEAAGGTYVDVWEGFVDENGDYAAVGPQLDGRTGRLRLDDGVHFSKAGARKLAHYVEQELRKTFKPKAPAEALAAAPADGGLGAPPEAARPKPLAGPLVVLTAGPRASEGGALLDAAQKGDRPASERREAPEAAPGRIDDHRWPPTP